MAVESWKKLLVTAALAVVVTLVVYNLYGRTTGNNRLHKRTVEVSMKTIYLVPIGDIDKVIIEDIAPQDAEIFSTDYKKVDNPLDIPKDAYNKDREQYLARSFLETLKELPESKKGLVIGIADVDIYTPELNFLFGLAEMGSSVCVMSVTRLRPEFYGNNKPDHKVLIKRSVTESVHELGHVVGLAHCPNPACVMFFSNSRADTDYKGKHFCDECAQLVRKGMSE
ncbi:MAG TPA: archaemetzincin family Zn-dependent metalloprotease [Armatimonadota bacterium]|nr:archaemetzincin family Zn-dependent metalloprotease [Armatimonadota bacterium]